MSSYRKADLIAALSQAPDDLDADALAEIANASATFTKYGLQPAAVTTQPPKPDRKAVARARLAELDAAPLPPGASESAKCKRATERAEAYAIALDMEGYTDHNGYTVRTGGGSAA